MWLYLLSTATIAVGAATVGLLWKVHRQKTYEQHLRTRWNRLSARLSDFEGSDLREVMQRDFDEWKLSSAECDVAWCLIRGLSIKDIGMCRSTSERTIRKQTQSIYAKARIAGRSELSGQMLAKFLNDSVGHGPGYFTRELAP